MSKLRFCNPRYACLLAPLVLLAGCDNVGSAFDPREPGTGPGTETNIQTMVQQGISVNGRPRVRNVFPEGSGWPGTVPIVVEFNESVNEASVAPQNGTPTLFVRPRASNNQGGGVLNPGGNLNPGNGQDPGNTAPGSTALPASYDFLLGGRVVVIRPTTAFDTSQIQEFEIVITSELRDADGIRFLSSGERVLGTFTPDQDSEIEDAEVLTTVPIDNSSDNLRDASVFLIFTKPINQATLTAGASGRFALQAGGTDLPGDVSFPVRASGLGGGNNDGRIAQFNPTATLPGGTNIDVILRAGITVGTSGELEFRNRTPFARFRTLDPEGVKSVQIGNSPSGTTNKVSQTNISSVLVDVELEASALPGDRVEVRIYGLDRQGGTSGAVSFVEAAANAPVAGAQTVTVDFGAQLGTAQTPTFLEGSLTLAATLIRGAANTGFTLSTSSTNPELDVTGPTIVFPAADTGGGFTYYTDQEYLVFHGTASETLGAATLNLATTPAPAPNPATGVVYGFGSSGNNGKFMFNPILLGRRTSPLQFTLTISDPAGNMAPAIVGSIVQRGSVTGNVSGGSLTVEAYDDTTFQPLSGALVIVEPGLPTAPATGRLTGTTDATGRAVFTGLTGSGYSVTVVRDGYDIVSMLNSAAAFMSLPLRPQTGATANFDGAATFAATGAQRALVGCNLFDDVLVESVQTTGTPAISIPSTAIRANRPYIATAFSGTFPATALPTFTNFACTICGANGLTREAMQTRVTAGSRATQGLTLIPAVASVTRFDIVPFAEDFSKWTGFGGPAATPTVSVMTSLQGIGGMTLTGAGYSSTTGTSRNINASYSGAMLSATSTLGPKFWVSTSSTDSDGNYGRHRVVINPTDRRVVQVDDHPKVSTLTAPGGASAGSPSITYQDRLSASITGVPANRVFAFQVVTATDSTGRRWRIIEQDKTTATAANVRQLPVMSGVSATMLRTGTWRLFVESILVYSLTFADDDYVLEELRREEFSYARTRTVDFTVN